MIKPVTAIIVGAGHRAMLYASYALKYPNQLKIIGVADKIKRRRQAAAEKFCLSNEQCFTSSDELYLKPKSADTIINGTMDNQHVKTSVPLLKAGYDILLEKPFATNEEAMWDIVTTAKNYNRKVMICHVLRYTPFYTEIKKRILTGEIGRILNIQTNEHVSYHHMAVGYVRGKWRNTELSDTTMLLAKCCHDLDIIMWIKSDIRPVSVSSIGSNFQFTQDRKPVGAGTRCMVDCDIEDKCLYSAKKHYIDHPHRWSFYVWDCLEDTRDPSIEQKIESLKNNNMYGRCVWNCDNNVVDHQSVLIKFEDGSTATHNMVGGTAKADRTIHIIGEKGEIQGSFNNSVFILRKIDPRPEHEYTEEKFDLNEVGDKSGEYGGHGGGDMRLVKDFIKYINNEPRSISCTSIEDSVNGHLTAFYADKSMKEHKIIDIFQAKDKKIM